MLPFPRDRDRPPFREPPSKNTNPPPCPHLKLFPTEEGSIPLPKLGESPYGKMHKLEISISGVLDQLNKLNPSKAQGPDAIPPWFLNTYAAQLAPILHNIVQFSVDSSQVPEAWKMLM